MLLLVAMVAVLLSKVLPKEIAWVAVAGKVGTYLPTLA